MKILFIFLLSAVIIKADDHQQEEAMRMSGRLFVISGPSGAGLNEIVATVIDSRSDIGHVVPVTARKMKAGEVNGENFWFFELEQWEEMKASGDMLECTEFAGNDYGTSRHLVKEQLDAGKNVVLVLETERAAMLNRNMPEAVCVYMEPSDPVILKGIYEKSARNSVEVDVRMRHADEQRRISLFCDKRIFTDDPQKAEEELNALIDG